MLHENYNPSESRLISQKLNAIIGCKILTSNIEINHEKRFKKRYKNKKENIVLIIIIIMIILKIIIPVTVTTIIFENRRKALEV